jgi:hypothetical protein
MLPVKHSMWHHVVWAQHTLHVSDPIGGGGGKGEDREIACRFEERRERRKTGEGATRLGKDRQTRKGEEGYAIIRRRGLRGLNYRTSGDRRREKGKETSKRSH